MIPRFSDMISQVNYGPIYRDGEPQGTTKLRNWGHGGDEKFGFRNVYAKFLIGIPGEGDDTQTTGYTPATVKKHCQGDAEKH